MSDLPDLPNPLPPGYKQLTIPADMMDYLLQYWEVRDHAEVMSWSIRLLHDLTKLDEAGWRLTLVKSEVDEVTKQSIHNPEYKQITFLMKWLCPTKDSYPRLPEPEMLNQYAKANTT